MKVRELQNKIQQMTVEDLEKMLKDSKEELFNLRFQLVTGHLENTSKVRVVRKTIARIKTAIHGVQLSERPETNVPEGARQLSKSASLPGERAGGSSKKRGAR